MQILARGQRGIFFLQVQKMAAFKPHTVQILQGIYLPMDTNTSRTSRRALFAINAQMSGRHQYLVHKGNVPYRLWTDSSPLFFFTTATTTTTTAWARDTRLV